MNEPITTTADYETALKTVELLMSAQARTVEGDRLDGLVAQIEAYEQRHLPMELIVAEQEGLRKTAPSALKERSPPS